MSIIIDKPEAKSQSKVQAQVKSNKGRRVVVVVVVVVVGGLEQFSVSPSPFWF